MQCSQFAFVCMHIYMYIYPSHFNCVGVVSVVSGPRLLAWSDHRRRSTCEKDRARAEMEQGPSGTGPTGRRSTCEKDHARAEMEQEQSKRDCARE